MLAVIAPPLLGLAVPVDTLITDPRNANRGDVAAIRRSLNVFGQRKPVVVRRTGQTADGRPTGIVIAGNHTLLAAIELGWDHVAATFVDDDESTAKAYALADNRTSELSAWDQDQLAETMRELSADEFDLSALGWTDDQLAALLNGGPVVTELPDADAVDAQDITPPAIPLSVPGDLWKLGRHRLLCGDATDPAHLDAVLTDVGTPGIVYTDPPYGISIVTASKVGGGGAFGGKKNEKPDGSNVIASSNYLPVAGDGTTAAAADAFRLLTTAYPDARQVWWGGNHYAASAGMPDSSCWLVWDKDNTGNFADAELAWTNHPGAVRLLRHMWNGMLRATERGKRVHPTQKPVALAEWAFTVVDADASRLSVLDVFGGSGSTLLAAERTGRTAAVIEIEPAYVDVICRRYQEHTGTLPVLASTGAATDFIQRAQDDEVAWP